MPTLKPPSAASSAASLAAPSAPSPALPIPPSTIRIKRPLDEAPVAALYVGSTVSANSAHKRVKTTPDASNPAYVFRLARTTVPKRFQPIAPGVPEVVDDAAPQLKPGMKRHSSSDLIALKPPEAADKKRKIAPVRKYRLSRKARVKHPHPYGTGPRSGSAVFERVKDEDEVMRDAVEAAKHVEVVVSKAEEPKRERKKPRTHPKEKEQIKVARQKEVQQQQYDFEFTKEMERLVLEYLDEDTNDGIRNLPPTPAPAAKDRVGGGVGGGTWDDKETIKDVIMTDEEDEGGFVYDVYFREEVPAGSNPLDKTEGEESYGVIVFAESEDEAWWYEGADEEDDRSDVYGSDDEDSNAEDFHTNDYPDEPVLAEDEEDEYGHDIHDHSDEDEEESDDELGPSCWRPWRQRTVPGEEEYDLDDSDEDEEPTLHKMARGIWSIG